MELAHALELTFTSADQLVRRQAEAYINTLINSSTTTYLLSILAISTDSTISTPVRISAAISFKNVVHLIQPESTDVAAVRAASVTTLFARESALPQRRALAEGIAVLWNPDTWPDLVPWLAHQCTNGEYGPALEVFVALTRPFRNGIAVPQIINEADHICDHVALPLHSLFSRQAKAITAQCLAILQSLFSLPYIPSGLGSLDQWVPLLTGALSLCSGEALGVLTVVSDFHADELAPHLEHLAAGVITLVKSLSSDLSDDSVACGCLSFLTSVAQSPHGHSVLLPHLRQLCLDVAIPSLMLRNDDLMMFEDDPGSFVAIDLEADDGAGTRRHGAGALLRALSNDPQVMAIVSSAVDDLVSQRAAIKGWIVKELAVRLVWAVSIEHTIASRGAIKVRGAPAAFFAHQILGDLTSFSSVPAPLIAGEVRYLRAFRRQLIGESYGAQIVPICAQLLRHQSSVVRSYASAALDSLLNLRMDNGDLIISTDYLGSDLAPLLGVVLDAAAADNCLDDGTWAMKALVRLVSRSGPSDALLVVAERLAGSLLQLVHQSASHPIRTHYLFETVGALITNVGCRLDRILFPPLRSLLSQASRLDLHPYALQLLAKLAEQKSDLSEEWLGVAQHYLLDDESWAITAHCSSLVRLVGAVLRVQRIFSPQLQSVLGNRIRWLLSEPSREHFGFALAERWARASSDVRLLWESVLPRLKDDAGAKIQRLFTHLMWTVAALHGPAAVLDPILDTGGLALMAMLIRDAWLPCLATTEDRSVAGVATVRLLCEETRLQSPPLDEAWPRLFDVLVETLKRDDVDVFEEEEEEEGFDSVLCRLAYAIESPFELNVDVVHMLSEGLKKMNMTPRMRELGLSI